LFTWHLPTSEGASESSLALCEILALAAFLLDSVIQLSARVPKREKATTGSHMLDIWCSTPAGITAIQLRGYATFCMGSVGVV